MRKIAVLLLLATAPLMGCANECFDVPSGEENIPIDTPGAVRLVKVIVLDR
jgi:hypothetical protein